jgi:hypothetical protein
MAVKDDDTNPAVHGAQPVLAIHLDDAVLHQNEEIRGHLSVRGANRELAVKAVTVHLLEYWKSGRISAGSVSGGAQYREFEMRTLSEEFLLPPFAEEPFPFVLRLPLNSRPTTLTMGWMLHGELGLKDFPHVVSRYRLEVKVAKEFLVVIKALEQHLGFTELSDQRQWDEKAGETTLLFTPPAVMRDKLQSIQAHLQQDGGAGFTGRITFQLPKKSIGDHLLSTFFHTDVVKLDVAMTGKQLFDLDGEPEYIHVARQFDDYLRDVVGESFRVRNQ